MANKNYSYLIEKLDQFIRKYYINQLIRGSLYTIALVLATYLIFSLLEYFFFFPSGVRMVLFFGFLGIVGFALYSWVAAPLMHYFQLGKVISHEQASRIIGSHFTNVQDKLLNVLQLHHQAESQADRDLIEASINQKIEEIKPVPFQTAINLAGNRKHLKYALVPLLAILFILVSAPNILQESNERLFYNTRNFEKPAPFTFELDEQNLQVMQFDDYPLSIDVKGEALPEQILAVADGYSYRMQPEDGNTFQYTFKKVQEDITFYLSANGYESEQFTLRVIPKPMVVSFNLDLDYPAYTGKKDEAKRNVGDVVVPAGTKVDWLFDSRNTSKLAFRVGDTVLPAQRQGDSRFTYSQRFFQDQPYTIFVGNNELPQADSIGYSITVIPDRYPALSVERFEDSVNRKLVYFLGEANDDYGLSQIALHYRVFNEEKGAQDEFTKVPLRSPMASNEARFSHTWNLAELNLKPGDQVKYYFIAWDNDQVNGSKYTKTPLMTFNMPTKEEMEAQTEESNNAIKNDLEKNVEEARKLQEEIRDMQERLLQKDELSWEDKQSVEDMIKKQKQLQKSVQSIQNEFQKNQKQQSEYKEQSERMQQKQQRLQELFDEVMSEEMQKMMDELEKMLEKLNQEQTMEELENMELDNEQLEKEMDRMLELFKQLEMEQKMNETIDKLEELAEKQDELSEESKKQEQDSKGQSEEEKAKKNEELGKKQEELNKEFEDVKENLSELDKMNEELNQNMPMDEMKEQQESIDENMQNSQQDLQQNKPRDASQKQKNASQQMQEMANKMNSMMMQRQMQQMMMDMEAIRMLLDNLIKLSFDQEGLMEEIQASNVNTPRYKELIQDQFKIREDLKMVEDSLEALGKRVFQLSSFINREITEVNHNLEKGIEFLADRKKSEGTARQQYVMTGLNNLALMLDESMQQMQQQMSSMMPGSQMCQQPKSGQNSMKNMQQMQQQLQDQMGKMMEEMQKSGSQEGKGGKRKMSKEFAQMAAKQAALRKALDEFNKQMNKDGKGSLGNLDEISNEMEKIEEDLVNKRLNEELMERQKEISIRLLEAEEAMREREQSPERESETADDVTKRVPPAIEEYLKQREAEIDLYKTVPPSLKPFYKNLVEDYFKSISIND